GPPLPFEPVGGDGDDLLDTLPFPKQPSAGDRAVAVETHAALLLVTAVEFLAQPFQPPDRLRLQPAIGQFLNAVSQSGFKIAPVERRRLSVEQIAPLLLQLWRRG